jgi:ferrous iron transport protein A
MQRTKTSTKPKAPGAAENTCPSNSPNQPNVFPEGQPENAAREVFLRNMASRQTGIIIRIDARGELGRRIRDMGLVPGTPIQVQGRAPLKDPVAVKVRDCVLTLRNNEADRILVAVEGVQDA